MEQAVMEYRRQFRRNLRCASRDKRQLRAQLEDMLRTYFADEAHPTFEDLCTALGDPDCLAQSMLDELPAEHMDRWKRAKRHRSIAAVFILLLLFGYLIYAAAIRPIELDISSTIVVHETTDDVPIAD